MVTAGTGAAAAAGELLRVTTGDGGGLVMFATIDTALVMVFFAKAALCAGAMAVMLTAPKSSMVLFCLG